MLGPKKKKKSAARMSRHASVRRLAQAGGRWQSGPLRSHLMIRTQVRYPADAKCASSLAAGNARHGVSAHPRSSIDGFMASNVFDLLSLKGRVVVVTGGARGIGLALAFAVAEVGADIAIIDAAEKPDEAYGKLQEAGPRVGYYQ